MSFSGHRLRNGDRTRDFRGPVPVSQARLAVSEMCGRIAPSRREVGVRIILANPRGFCAGVNMAIESLERALELYGAPIYVYHEIVHNRPVVERFRGRGVVFVNDVSEIPARAHVLYSAHGVAPAIRAAAAERRLHAID